MSSFSDLGLNRVKSRVNHIPHTPTLLPNLQQPVARVLKTTYGKPIPKFLYKGDLFVGYFKRTLPFEHKSP